jgi:hypothetical protein
MSNWTAEKIARSLTSVIEKLHSRALVRERANTGGIQSYLVDNYGTAKKEVFEHQGSAIEVSAWMFLCPSLLFVGVNGEFRTLVISRVAGQAGAIFQIHFGGEIRTIYCAPEADFSAVVGEY